MKRLVIYASLLSFLIVQLFLLGGERKAFSYSTGSANNGGNTGSPGDGGQTDAATCAQSFCHDDASAKFNSGLGSITTNIPASGYVPGQTYTITASITKSGHDKFGFELTAETPGGTKIGTLSEDSSETQLTNNGNAVTHEQVGTSGSGGKAWIMEWKAPSAGNGEVHFWAAFNVTNNDGTSGGDTIHVDSISVQEDTSSTVIPTAKMMEGHSLQVFPNPVRDRLTLQKVPQGSKEGELLLRDLQGRIVKQLYQGDLSRTKGRSFQIGNELEAGTYLLEMRSEGGREVERILVR